MELRVHIPACHRRGFTQAVASPTRLFMIRQAERPIEIGLSRETPKMLRLEGRMTDARQMNMLGKAAFATLLEHEPRFHRFVCNRQVMLTEGTTILLTGRDRLDRETLLATWDVGEPYLLAMRRLGECRRMLSDVPADVVVEHWQRSISTALPPPQVLISVVMSAAPDEVPRMSLGGCAGTCPIAIAAGPARIDFVFDHRLYDYSDEKVFTETFMKALCEA